MNRRKRNYNYLWLYQDWEISSAQPFPWQEQSFLPKEKKKIHFKIPQKRLKKKKKAHKIL